MKVLRHFTTEHVHRYAGQHVYQSIEWKKVNVLIKDKDGRVVCKVDNLEVPAGWSQSAAEILAHKYLRKVGVHPEDSYTREEIEGLPTHLSPVKACTIKGPGGPEVSAHQVFHRIAGHWAYSGFMQKYFTTAEDAQAYYDEMYWMLAHQMAAPNSPQWFNTGIWWAYGIDGLDCGAWRASNTGMTEATRLSDSYRYPQTSACFILDIRDSLLGDGGILDTLKTEAHIFKYGSGCGINYSSLRAVNTPLSNGGVSSGLMSFLKIFDTNAGAIKSGGTTRRAARMVVVNADHPEAEAFVTWKAKEEVKVAAMALGATSCKPDTEIAKEALKGLTTDYESEAYQTVSGQNANNSLRVSHAFMQCVTADANDPRETSREKSLWGKLIDAAWTCGDPGIQFDDTCNDWHTIPKVGRHNATNPCSEFSFIDNSSCNLASVNLVKFLGKDVCEPNNYIDAASFEYAVRMWTLTLDLTVGMSSYPTKEVAENSVKYRPLGLGYANLGGLLMLLGVPYASDEGRRIAAVITSAMQAIAWNESNRLAGVLGEFTDFAQNAGAVERVRNKHKKRHASLLVHMDNDPVFDLHEVATTYWESELTVHDDEAIRNAQLTLLAPTGTIGLVMDVATTGIEPDFSLVKYKKLAGGGSMTLVNPYVTDSLIALGYTAEQIAKIKDYIKETGRVDKLCPEIKVEHIPVYACANDIDWRDHIAMMAAVQPFLSGAISKTVNMPNSATRTDVEDAYVLAWQSGLKALAIYRDGCKHSQPLTAVVRREVVAVETGREDVAVSTAAEPVVRGRVKQTRYKLKSRRRGITQKVSIGDMKLYLRTGEYDDGSLGEIFLTISREGSTLNHLLGAVAMAISLGLQYGVPLDEYVDAFVDTKSEPNGLVQGSDEVRMCSSLLDYVARQLDADYGHRQFLPKTNEPETVETGEAPKSAERIAIKSVVPDEPVEDDIMKDKFIPPRLVAGGFRALSAVAPVTLAQVRYTGEACCMCKSFTLRRNGSCFLCDTCGSTTGCS